MILDYFLMALSNLKHRGLRSWLTMLGIFIGIASVVSLISLGAGLQEAITGQFSTLSADRLVVQNAGTGFGPPGSTAIKKLTEHDLKLIESIQGVEEAIPRLIRIVKVEYNDKSQFTYVGSLPKEQKEIDYLYTTFQMKPQLGKLVNSDNKRQIILGHDFADDKIFGKEIQPGSTLRIQGEDFKVSGILKEMSSFQFNSAIFMLEEDMKSLLKLNDEIDLIVVQVESQDKTDSVAKDIERKLRKDRNLDEGKEDFSVETPVRALDAINTILNVINAVIAGIAAISLLVGGIGIANTMFTSVLERTKEIGTMKALGAKNKDILLIFLIESGLLGLVGGIIGAGIGLGLAFGISFLANSALGSTILAVQISWPLLIASVSFSFIIGVGSGILPAIQGSNLKPVEALRR